ncbi:MAG: hypothetical protein AABZ06_14560 [Bdellovibrionota bacterium]
MSFVYPYHVFADYPKSGLKTQDEIGGNEYVSGNYPGAVLMRVNLWGGVGKPGIHFVPTNTDVVSLFSYAGGPAGDAVLDDITLRRMAGSKETEQIPINLGKLMYEGKGNNIILQPNDIIVVPTRKPLINTDVVTIIGFTLSVFSLVLTGYAVSQIAASDKNK